MNIGKICVSVHADTFECLLEKIQRVSPAADLIEIRFDGLTPLELAERRGDETVVSRILRKFPDKHFLVTLRPESEGGMRSVSLSERLAFWNSKFAPDLIDIEKDIVLEKFECSPRQRILSFHDFDGSEDSIAAFAAESLRAPADILKIASMASDATDGLVVWKHLAESVQRSLSGPGNSKQLIPIAMGEAGKWTRILGPAFGSPIAYASQDGEAGIAPGQIPFGEMDTVYRVKELGPGTEIYGLISKHIAHSMSPFMHNSAFKARNLDAVYIPFEVKDLAAFLKRMVRPETREIDWNLQGFSVTIPYKEAIIDHLDFVDPAAEAIGAVNTVQIVEDQLVGFNTDAEGFVRPLTQSFGDLRKVRAAVIGAGGAARACVYALKKQGALPTVFARAPAKADAFASEFDCSAGDLNELPRLLADFQIVVNATPLGTKGDLENQTPSAAADLKNLQLAYDLVYNPIDTLFLQEARKAKVPVIGGLDMLIAQGASQFELWTGQTAPVNVMDRAVRSRLL